MQYSTNTELQPRVKRRRKQRRTLRLRASAIALLVLTLLYGQNIFKLNEGSASGDLTKKVSENIPLDMQETTTSPSVDDWQLVLVNPWNNIPGGYEVVLTQLRDGQAVDQRCYPDLQKMLDDCRAAGLEPLLCSSYRTQTKQEQLFNNKVDRLVAQGYSRQEAPTEAAKAVALPGTSEHQLGLAVDIVDINNQNLDSSQEHTSVQQWLMKNSWKYGFILRYPTGKSSITGIMYEPWHYRYVGKEAAKEIYEQGICLEEYLADRG